MKLRKKISQNFLPVWSRIALAAAALENRGVPRLQRPIRIAFVKPASYRDLYTKTGLFDKELALSTPGRTGPVGLIEPEFNAEHFIVHNSLDEECRVSKIEDPSRMDTHHREAYEKHHRRVGAVAIAPDAIDWSQYDAVWAFENCIPARITLRHPSVVWASMLEYHMHPKFLSYLRHPPKGYDVFFTQACGWNLRSTLYGKHVVDWPYTLAKSSTLSRLFSHVSREQGLFMTEVSHDLSKTAADAKDYGFSPALQKRSGVRVPYIQYIEALARSKYYLSPAARRPLWGNALPEVGSAGCLILANPWQNWNPYPIAKKGRITSIVKAFSLMKELNNDAYKYSALKREQDQLIDWHCFYRPILGLLKVAKECKRRQALSISDLF